MLMNFLTNAKANIKGGKMFSNITGTVLFRETSQGVLVTAKIYNLPQSNTACKGRFFGFHIHEGNSCTGDKTDEFKNSKGHLNLNMCPHPFHAGDFPPLLENNGYAYSKFLTNKFKISEIIGKVIIIHDLPDDFTTHPSGNSGTKIACGVIYNKRK